MLCCAVLCGVLCAVRCCWQRAPCVVVVGVERDVAVCSAATVCITRKEECKECAATFSYQLIVQTPTVATTTDVHRISDRISAYECIWRSESGMQGVPGKGAALNAISNHWFSLFKEKGTTLPIPPIPPLSLWI